MTRFRPIPFIVCVIILASSVGVSRRVWAAPTSATPVISASETVQKLTFEHLEKQAGGAIKPPAFPDEKLLMWMDKRNETVTDNEKSRYKLLGEHLLIARQLLESDDVAARKRGFWMASESANFAAAKLNKDKWLLARIYEGFLLPRVALANTELWRDPSRSRILEAGVSAFANAGERDKQIRVLEWLISIGQKTEEKNRARRLDVGTQHARLGARHARRFAC